MHKIGFISPYTQLADRIRDLARQADLSVEVRIADGDEAIAVAKEMIAQGVQVIISRGGTALFLKDAVEIPVVEITISPIDVIRTIRKGGIKKGRIGLCGYRNIIFGIDLLRELLEDFEILPVVFTGTESFEEKLEKVKSIADSVDFMVGDNIAIQMARLVGCRSILIDSSEDSLILCLFEAKKILDATFQERNRKEELQTILDYSQEGIISIDGAGNVRFINAAAQKLLDLSADAAKNKNVKECLPYVNYEEILITGESDLEKIITIKDKNFMIQTVPIRIASEITGAVSLFQDISQIRRQEEKIRKKFFIKEHLAKYSFSSMITGNQKMDDLVETAKVYAKTSSNILILGETGTGKEYFAQSIHNDSGRRHKPFVAINCAALPDNLLESELFGYEEGAFTGAKKGGKPGIFEMAHEGTIFLDEISEISPQIQGKLLRTIQEKQVMRLGSAYLLPVDVRIIAATGTNLKKAMEEGTFRKDLFYRLNVLTIKIPPLRERIDAIPFFVDAFIKKYCNLNSTEVKTMDPAAIEFLQDYMWNGNVRELENCIERLVVLVREPRIKLHHIKQFIEDFEEDPLEASFLLKQDKENKFPVVVDASEGLRSIEVQVIRQVLSKNKGNVGKTAELLKIGRTTVWRKMNEDNREE